MVDVAQESIEVGHLHLVGGVSPSLLQIGDGVVVHLEHGTSHAGIPIEHRLHGIVFQGGDGVLAHGLVLVEVAFADDEVLPRVEVGAVDGQGFLVLFLGFYCVFLDEVIRAEDEVAEFVVGMGLNKGLSTLPRLLADVGRALVFVHPIVVGVGFGGDVEVFVANGVQQFVEGLVRLAVHLIEFEQRDVDVRMLRVDFLHPLVGLQGVFGFTVFGVKLSQQAVVAKVVGVLLDEFLQLCDHLFCVALASVDAEALLGDQLVRSHHLFQDIHLFQCLVVLLRDEVGIDKFAEHVGVVGVGLGQVFIEFDEVVVLFQVAVE